LKLGAAICSLAMNVGTMKSGTIEEWENIARKMLADPHASRSEVDSVLIGITRSRDVWLIAELKKKRKKAWTA
tara:strand:- start:496 stop:714 length:219 start_codon:yes stop_codon:yes gene_type:complete